MRLDCNTLRFYFIKRRHAEHLQWYLMRKASTDWLNLYGSVALVMGNTIYSRGGSILTATSCPTRYHWFVKFIRESKLIMGVIKNQDFVIPCKVVKALLEIW